MDASGLYVVLFVLLALAVALFMARSARRRRGDSGTRPGAQAEQWLRRLTGGIGTAPPPRTPAARRSADAAAVLAERARGLLAGDPSPAAADRAQRHAVEGLHQLRAARIADGADPGAPLPPLPGAAEAGAVHQERSALVDGQRMTASPAPSDATPCFHPGGTVRGRPVPAGWYSKPWWEAALTGAGWPPESVGLFDALLAGDPGVRYDGADFESGTGSGR